MYYIRDIAIYRVYNGDIMDHKGIYTYRMFVVTCGYFWDSCGESRDIYGIIRLHDENNPSNWGLVPY
jgi:hypothetical protein